MGGDSAADLITKVKGVGREALDRWPLGELERLEKVFQSWDGSVCALIERGVGGGILLKEAYGSSRPGCPTR